MANKSFTVQYLIKARDLFTRDANKAAKSLGGIDKKGKKANDVLKKTNKQSKIATKSFKKMGGAIKFAVKGLAGFAVGALGGLVGVIKVGSKFETSMADLAAITGATGDSFDLLKKKALEMSISTVTAQTEVALAMKLVGSASPELLKNIPALSAMTKEVLLLKNNGIETEVAVKALTGSLNAFGKDASFANEFVNILAAGSEFGGSEMRDTVAAMTAAGPAAVDAGLSFAELNAAIQTTAKGNIFAAQAGTALSAIFLELRLAGRDIGKVGLQKTFQILGKELQATTTDLERAELQMEFFGKEHGKVGMALIRNAQLLGNLEKKVQGTDSAHRQAAKRLATFDKALEKISLIIKGSLIKVFDKLAPKLTDIANKFGVWFDQISDNDIKEFSASLLPVIDAAVEISKVFGFILKVLGSIVKLTSILANVRIPVPDFVAEFLGGEVRGEGAKATLKKKAEKIPFILPDAFNSGINPANNNFINDFGANTNKIINDFGSNNTNTPRLQAAGSTNIRNQVDVGVQVGLDKGLKETAPTRTIKKSKRNDTGMGFAEVPA